MALKPCPECGRQVSDKATHCPGCGPPITEAVGTATASQSITTASAPAPTATPTPTPTPAPASAPANDFVGSVREWLRGTGLGPKIVLCATLFLACCIVFAAIGTALKRESAFELTVSSIYKFLFVDSVGMALLSIFSNNASVAFLCIGTGLLCRAVPVVVIMWNGIVTGLILGGVTVLGASWGNVIGSLFPHGLFELPAIFMAGAIGMQMRQNVDNSDWIRKRLPRLILVVLGLLVIAAILESLRLGENLEQMKMLRQSLIRHF